MIPLKLDIENFLAFGPKQSIDFTRDKLWIIGGDNGVGKSTIFDAITYCLFSDARGSRKEELIRQGTNGFRLSYTFQLGSVFYRVARNHNGKTPTQSAEKADAADGPWRAVPNTTGAKALDKWVEELLGISREMYSSSIMLEQGKADAIITANGPRRREILKQILGIDRFETIWKPIDADRLIAERTMKAASAKLQNLPCVTADDVALAAIAQVNTNAAYETADEAYTAALVLPAAAAEWERLTAESVRLQAELDAGAALLSRRAEIEANAARLTLLERLVPALAARSTARAEAAAAAEELAAADARYAAASATIVSLDEEQQRDREKVRAARRRLDDLRAGEPELKANAEAVRRELQACEAIAELARALAEFPPSLDDDQTRDRAALAEAEAEEIAARMSEAGLKTKDEAAAKQLAKFDALGGECSECGQTVTAEHADKERAKLRDARARCAADLAAVAVRLCGAIDGKKTLKAALERRDKLARGRDTTTQRLADARKERKRPNEADDALRAELADTETGLNAIAAALPELQAVLEPAATREVFAERQLKTLRGEHAQRTQTLAKLQADYERKAERLTQAEAAVAEHPLQTDEEATLTAERDALQRLPVRAEAEQLAVDSDKQQQRQDRLTEATLQLEQLPEQARKPKATVEAECKLLQTARREADLRRTEADTNHLKRLAGYTDHQTAQTVHRTAERDASLRSRLADMLGPKGLQRELVRSAEREILREGCKLLHDLSDNELTLETVPSDTAFELRVRKHDLPDSIDAAQTSGGEKFRTSVAVAVAISRFAAKRLRPLECVMIDEGFGSLDQAGKRNITNALERLKQHVGRILLVSHEPSFAEAFSSRIQLEKRPEGTVVVS